VTRLRALALAPAALAWLRTARSPRVLHVFDRACNLVDEAGEVLSVVTHERGMTPFGLMLETSAAPPFAGLTVESTVLVQPEWLEVGHLHFPWADAASWQPRPDWPAVRAAHPQALNELAALVHSSIPAISLQAVSAGHAPGMVAAPPASLLELHTSSSLPAPLRARVMAGAADLVGGLHAGDAGRAVAGGRQLAGAGGGLTPAGDDFIVGVSLAAWAGLYGAGGPDLCALVVAEAAPLTATLSAAYLRAAARGECAAPWHVLFAALAQPEAAGRLAALGAAVGVLLRVGHTSGADGLAGFLAYNQAANWRQA
jgi:hypothetical protein